MKRIVDAIRTMLGYALMALFFYFIISRITSGQPKLPVIGLDSWCILNLAVVSGGVAALMHFTPAYKPGLNIVFSLFTLAAFVLVSVLTLLNGAIGFICSLGSLVLSLCVLVPINLRSGLVALKRPQSIDYFFDDSMWVIAVSRKFNDPEVDNLFSRYILPVLREEGIVLECSYASDDINSVDYWTTRMQMILELSDLHIFVEQVTSPYTQAEFEWSEGMIQRPSMIGASLLLMFKQDGPISQILNEHNNKWARLVYPFMIRISPHFPQKSFPLSARIAEVPFDGKDQIESFQSNLREMIHEAKRRRRIEFFDLFGVDPDFDWDLALSMKEELALDFAMFGDNTEYNKFIKEKQANISADEARMHLFTHKVLELTIKEKQGTLDIWNDFPMVLQDIRLMMENLRQEINKSTLPKILGCLPIGINLVLVLLQQIFRMAGKFVQLFRRFFRLFS